MPSTMPVMSPVNAVGTTTLRIVFHFGTPRAYDASRNSFGTSLSISSVVRTMTGTMRMTSASDTSQPDSPDPKVCTNSA